MYYSGDVWRSDGSVASKPNMMTNVPWDGSYPWRIGGVSAKFPNGDTFKVNINPSLSDPSWAGLCTPYLQRSSIDLLFLPQGQIISTR